MVAMNTWPTDGANGSVANEARWRKMARHWVPSGVLAGVGGLLAPTLAGLNLTVKSGACWVDGHFAELLADQVLAVTANGLAVVRFDPASNTAELLWRDGITVPAQNPNGTWELPIAQTIGSALTDLRKIYDVNSADAAIANLLGAWTLYTPTQTNGTGGNPATGWYLLLGKTLIFNMVVGAASATAAGDVTVSLPPGMVVAQTTDVGAQRTFVAYSARIPGGGTSVVIRRTDGTVIPAGQAINGIVVNGIANLS